MLERAYEVKRVLISRHHTLMLNLSALEKETTSGLTKLADDARQHVASLSALGVSIAPETIVNVKREQITEGDVRQVGSDSRKRRVPNALPIIRDFRFKTAVCASRRERAKESEKCRDESPAKRRR